MSPKLHVVHGDTPNREARREAQKAARKASGATKKPSQATLRRRNLSEDISKTAGTTSGVREAVTTSTAATDSILVTPTILAAFIRSAPSVSTPLPAAEVKVVPTVAPEVKETNPVPTPAKPVVVPKVDHSAEIAAIEATFFAQGDNLTYREYVAAVALNAEIVSIASLPEIGDEFRNAVNATRKDEGHKPLFDLSGLMAKFTFASIATAAAIAVFSLVTSISSAAHNYVDEQINGKHFTTTHIQDTTTIEFVEGIERSSFQMRRMELAVLRSVESN